jgi:hypothetical protein
LIQHLQGIPDPFVQVHLFHLIQAAV